MIYLDLKDCLRFDDDMLINLVHSLPPTLSEFSLKSIGSAVTVTGINACLEKILGCPQLVKLFLIQNNIDDDGAKLIADALKTPNQSLNTLDLMLNNIGDVGVMAIADAFIVNHNLTKLNLVANYNITTRGNEYLSILKQGLPFVNPYIDVVWSKPSTITTGDIESNYRSMQGCSIPEVELRGISIKQLRAVYAEIIARCEVEGWMSYEGQLLIPEKCNLYDIKDRIIMKRTESQQCSYVELIATGPQKPTRFVSHWWGEPVIAMIRCLDQHCKDHYLSEETTYYWICAYAINQHKIADEMLTNPFLKAMSICEGTVSILDAECVVYSRIWSFFGLFKSVMGGNSNYEFNVYTEIDGDRAVGITHGYIPSDGHPNAPISTHKKMFRESKFPLDRILQATNVDVKQAQASVESDRKLILNSITGRSVDDAVVDDHSKYDELNNILRGIFVSPGLDRIIREKDLDTITRCLEIVQASNVRTIYLDLKDCSRFDDDVLINLVHSLPPTLSEFSLKSIGSAVTVNGINACLLEKILGCTQLVKLFLSQNSIDDDGAKLIADALKTPNQSLNTLDLALNNIGDDGVMAIADALIVNRNLTKLNLLANNNITTRGKEYLSIMKRGLPFVNPYIDVVWSE